MIKNIFFDFDGVILDSVDCKTDAFYNMYKKYGNNIANDVKKYHIENGGISRFQKFKYWHKKYFNIELNDAELNSMSNDFSKIVLDQVLNSNEINGAFDFIKSNHKKFKFFIITGTPTSEIIKIIKNLELFNFFIDIGGSPENKTYWTEFFISKYDLKREETIFLGDAVTDYNAAVFSNLKFALRVANYNKKLFKNMSVLKFKKYKDLENFLKK